jgi:hypothetical protein
MTEDATTTPQFAPPGRFYASQAGRHASPR